MAITVRFLVYTRDNKYWIVDVNKDDLERFGGFDACWWATPPYTKNDIVDIFRWPFGEEV